MHTIVARNVNDAYRAGLTYLTQYGFPVASRVGPVIRALGPVTTVYRDPCERVLFSAQRNANPFFHLFEALWMLNGQNDVETLDHILPSFKQFSDDGQTYHGAYGYRWRHWPSRPWTVEQDFDQLKRIIAILRRNPDDRRAVLAMWDPVRDLDHVSNDIPCNDLIKFEIVQYALTMQVYNRSNDVVLGCYGANAVHMSILQEYIAAMVGVAVGTYFQISGNYHAYLEAPYALDSYVPFRDSNPPNPYEHAPGDSGTPIQPYPLVNDPVAFDEELALVMRMIHSRTYHRMPVRVKNRFFERVAQPMYRAFIMYKEHSIDHAIQFLADSQTESGFDIDWLVAGQQWLNRIAEKRNARRATISPREDVR